MALLRSELTGRAVSLGGRVVVGRAGACALRIASRVVSNEHASLWWESGAWMVRDNGSRNGTRVDGRLLAPGERARLRAGSSLVFGHEEHRYTLVDAGPPVAVARGPSGEVVSAEGGVLCLPSPAAPEVMLFQRADGGWVAESERGVELVGDGDPLSVGGAAWLLHLPLLDATTLKLDGAEGNAPNFGVVVRHSRDEEHVEVVLELPAGPLSLPARAHHELLLALARAWVADASQPPAERGWCYADQVQRDLGLDAQRFNVHVFRARQQLCEHVGAAAASVIERRTLTGQVRLAAPRVLVTPLGAGA